MQCTQQVISISISLYFYQVLFSPCVGPEQSDGKWPAFTTCEHIRH